jgi:type 1 glutamine amidotransferase/sugar phosphate isomerase/epimerase
MKTSSKLSFLAFMSSSEAGSMMKKRIVLILGMSCLLVGQSSTSAASGSPNPAAAGSYVTNADQRQLIEQALPAKAAVEPAKPRRLLIFSRNVGYGGHRPSRAHASEAFTLMGRKTGAFETTVSEDPAVFERESLQRFDAVFLNNTIGNTFTNADLRQNLLEFVTGGGGLMGVHGTSIAFMDWQWPPIEDWPEFGHMLGARGAYHRDDKERVWIRIDEPAHPLSRAFDGQGFERCDEFFRFHTPYSRQLDRVLLSLDVAKTDLSGFKPDEHLLRQDNDYAVAWIRNYGRGRVFYCSLAHSDSVFRDAKMLQFYLDAAQFVLGDLNVPTTPSAKLSPAVLAQEKLGWRLGIEAYTFHKFTFFETIEKAAGLGLPYIGGLSFMQRVSEDTPKNFDQHLTDDELRHIRLKMDSGGVRLLTYYAQDIPGDEAGCRKLFEFGRKMGIETFMCEPKPEQLDLLDKLANEYGINVAIHNHGQNISPLYWRPEGVRQACEGRSKRIGAAPDLGYWLRSGIDPVEAARLLKDRIITVQMHDLHEPGGNGHDVPWGTGIGNSEEFFRELHRQGIKPTMIGLEYSHDWFESMPKIAKCIEFFNATTLQLAPETQAKSSGDAKKINVLVVTGGHHFDPEPFFGIFKGCDDIQYVEHHLKDESEVFEDVSQWNYDVVLLYNMTQKISPKRQDNFVRLLKDKGVGVVVVHHAEAAFQSWPEFHQIIGTAYIYFDVEVDGKLWPHCKCKGGQDIAVSIRDDQHPITRGMKDFTIRDETYKGRWWAKDNHVLLTTDHPDNDKPVAWTRQYGRSRVFNLQFGHDQQAYACPEYRDLLVRGVRWTAGVIR